MSMLSKRMVARCYLCSPGNAYIAGTEAITSQALPKCAIFHMDWWKTWACCGSVSSSWEVGNIFFCVHIRDVSRTVASKAVVVRLHFHINCPVTYVNIFLFDLLYTLVYGVFLLNIVYATDTHLVLLAILCVIIDSFFFSGHPCERKILLYVMFYNHF